MNKPRIMFCKFEDEDYPLMEQWLKKPHVSRWYEKPEDWLYELHNRNGEFSFINHFIVQADDKPIGFCQYYDGYFAKEDWYNATSEGELFSIDYLIGDKDYLGKGYGKLIIKKLTELIKDIPSSKKIVVQPDNENFRSCNVLIANGYQYDEKSDMFVLALK